MNGIYLQLLPDGQLPYIHVVYMADVSVLNKRFGLGLYVTDVGLN